MQNPNPYNTSNNGYPNQAVSNNPIYPQSGINPDTIPTSQKAMMNYGNNIEQYNESDPISALSEATLRNGFIRKVYCILSAQLILTTLVCAFGMTHPDFYQFQITHVWVLYVLFVVEIVTLIALACSKTLARTVPINYVLLLVFTLAESYLVAMVCASTRPELVLMAAVFTAGITLALTFYAFTTKSDPTLYGQALFTFLTVMFIADEGFFMLFTNNPVAQIVYCGLAALMYAGYLVYDTALIIGRFSQSLSIDDYVFAAVNIYIDIIGLFLEILSLLNRT